MPVPEHVLRADVGGQVRLLGYDIELLSARPGQAFRFTLYWEAQRAMDRDWSVFCHVVDLGTGLSIATRDRYPGQGLVASSLMSPGLRWADDYVVDLPETAYAPTDALLEIGLYDVENGERPPILIEEGEGTVVENALRFQPVHIVPRSGDLPNPVRLNFEDKLVLTGWDLDRRVVVPGESIELVLHWTCPSSMKEMYTVSAQVLSPGGAKIAQWDSWPGEISTASCSAGQQIVDHKVLSIAPDVSPGAYDLQILVYDGATMKRARIINAEGRVLPNDFHILDRIRVSQ
jgi:hypothetical protein